MSRQRLEAFLDALTSRHWELVTSEENSHSSVDPFCLEDESIIWAIRRADGPVITLEFQAFGRLGRRTNNVNDIFWCLVSDEPEVKLYFSKINTTEWQDNLRRFIWTLDEVVKRAACRHG